jgi:hypothetical protein
MEGETKKHGFFMIAEMVLIIVGITVAIQLDNWTSNSGDRRNERALLEQLQGEFEQVKKTIDTQLVLLNKIDESYLKLYKACGVEKVNWPEDELLKLIARTYSDVRLNLYQGVLEDAINTGKLSLVENDKLRIQLYSWKNGVLKIQSWSDGTYDNTIVFLRYVFTILSFRNYDNDVWPEIELGESTFPNDPNVIFNDISFENSVGDLFYRNKRLIKSYDTHLIKPLEELLKLLEEELEKSTPNEHSKKD